MRASVACKALPVAVYAVSVYVRIVSCLLTHTHSHLRQEATQRHPFIFIPRRKNQPYFGLLLFFFCLAHPLNSWWLVLRIIFIFCGRGRTECNLSVVVSCVLVKVVAEHRSKSPAGDEILFPPWPPINKPFSSLSKSISTCESSSRAGTNGVSGSRRR